MAARDTALAALIACRRQGAWSDGVLKDYIHRDGLDRRDAALASQLCYGVLQNRLLLDFYIASFLQGRLKDLQPVVLDILRLGMYQLTQMDKIPASAAVSEAVEQGKRLANRRAAGLINGLLRSAARAQTLPEPPDLATRYSHPEPLVALLEENLPAGLTESFLKSDNEAPPLCVQVNTTRCRTADVAASLEASGVAVTRHPYLPDCLLLTGAGRLDALAAYQAGEIYAQDPAARLAVAAAGVRPGDRILDCCAAPGGKSFAAAIAMEDRGQVLSCDIHEHKIALLQRGAGRLGLKTVTPLLHDAKQLEPQWERSMDVVIADVPCSGLGVIRKKPDIRYKELGQTARLPDLQGQILQTAGRYVKPAGILLYSTCTVLKRENEQVVEAFLRENPAFSLEPFPVPAGAGLENEGMLTLYPCVHGTDGFFIARLRRAR